MASATTSIYETYTLYTGASTNSIPQINHAASGAFKVMFLTASYTFVNEQSVEAQLTANEEDGSGGYTVGGETIANVTFTLGSSGTATFDGDNVIVTASGGDLSARFMAVIHSAAASSDRRPLMFLIDPAQVETAGDGTTFNINWSADGIVQIKPG